MDALDCGPISFKMFNSWIMMNGFSEIAHLVFDDFVSNISLIRFVHLKNKVTFVKSRIKE